MSPNLAAHLPVHDAIQGFTTIFGPVVPIDENQPTRVQQVDSSTKSGASKKGSQSSGCP